MYTDVNTRKIKAFVKVIDGLSVCERVLSQFKDFNYNVSVGANNNSNTPQSNDNMTFCARLFALTHTTAEVHTHTHGDTHTHTHTHTRGLFPVMAEQLAFFKQTFNHKLAIKRVLQ